METIIIIVATALLLAVIVMAFVLYLKNVEISRLEDRLSKTWKAPWEWAHHYETYHRFLIVSEDLTEYMKRESEKLENEGYHYNKDKSFPTVLCFTKTVEIQKDQTEEILNQTF